MKHMYELHVYNPFCRGFIQVASSTNERSLISRMKKYPIAKVLKWGLTVDRNLVVK